MSSITPSEIRQEFFKSKIGIAGIAILAILIISSIVAIITIPIETFQEWNNPGSWISYPKVAMPSWVNIFTVQKIQPILLLITTVLVFTLCVLVDCILVNVFYSWWKLLERSGR